MRDITYQKKHKVWPGSSHIAEGVFRVSTGKGQRLHRATESAESRITRTLVPVEIWIFVQVLYLEGIHWWPQMKKRLTICNEAPSRLGQSKSIFEFQCIERWKGQLLHVCSSFYKPDQCLIKALC